jgi:hypothetical protein
MIHNNDNVFNIIVYIISIYLILIKTSIPINICGWLILLSHIYKYVTNIKNWPKWCEMFGIIIAITLICSGFKIKNYFIIFLGSIKFVAHMRECIFKDNCYY